MKKVIKNLLTVCAVAVMLVILGIMAFAAGTISDFSVNTAAAENSSELGATKWFKATDGNYYIFLPKNADNSEMTVWFTADSDVYCAGEKLVSGQKTAVFASEGKYTLTCGDSSYTVIVMKASDSASVYINTTTGSLDSIYADINLKEAGTALFVDADGETQYDGKLEYIKGRGNSTWLADKKAFNIKLDKKTNLFDIGKSKKWCLLANAYDSSLIKNQLALDLAKNIGVEYTSDSTQQLNLYVNNEYMGVYLITEKVEIDENRVDIYDLEKATEEVNENDLDSYELAGAQGVRTFGTYKYVDIPNDPEEITGGYLLELEKIYRYVDEVSGFITTRGQSVVVKTPEYATKAQAEYISSYWSDFEDALYSETGYNSKGMYYTDYLDIESLAKMYIIDEYTSTYDGCSSSFYFYKDVDGKLTACTAWDFDGALGHQQPNDLITHVPNNGDTSILYIKNCFIGTHAEGVHSLLGEAYLHQDFREAVAKIWTENFLPYYDTFLGNIGLYRDGVMSSAVMNSIRWNTFGTTDVSAINSSYTTSAEAINTFAKARYATLSVAFASDTYYVLYDSGELGTSLVADDIMYSLGDKATVKAAPSVTKTGKKFDCWSTHQDGTGETYKEGDIITVTKNTVLYAQWTDDMSLNARIAVFMEKITEFLNNIVKFFRGLFTE